MGLGKSGSVRQLPQTFDRSLRTSWHASHSQIYPELGKLERAGLVEVAAAEQTEHDLGLTGAGREELRRWLVEAEPNRSQRKESGVRLFLTPLLDPIDRCIAQDRDLRHVQVELDELEGRWAEVELLGERDSVHRRFHDQIAAADREAGF